MKQIILIASLFLLSSCFKEQWEGFVYPNKGNLTNHVAIGIFTSLEECRDHSLAKLEEISSISAGDYECALNCKEGSLPKICEKTEH
ncbi:MAG TPA: hypothetical protein VFS88_05170 [Micavibrio sp.]|nr:hypothetical protein [Micavibrio sp.]